MKTIYIHIGCEKTGTTAIQHFLSNNRENLLNQGVSYPEMGLLDTGHFNLAAAIDNWCKNFSGVDYYPNKNVNNEKEWDAFLNHCRKTKKQSIVISAEHFSSRLSVIGIEWMRSKLSELGSEYTFKIIVYIRRQDWFIESSYSTAIKAGYTKSFDTFFKANLAARKRYDFYQLLGNWAQFFGKEYMIVKDYDAIPRAGLIHEFCSLVTIDTSSLINEDIQKNTSLSPSMLEFTKLVNSSCAREILGASYLPFIKTANELLGNSKQKVTIMSDEQRSTVLESYKESNNLVLKNYFTNNDLFQKTHSAADHIYVQKPAINHVDILSTFARFFVKTNPKPD